MGSGKSPQNIGNQENKTKIDQLVKLNQKAEEAGGKGRVDKQHEKGKLTARERVELLLDPGSFQEVGKLVLHRGKDFDIDKQQFLGDGVITGYGTIDDRLVYVFSHDFTVFGGSLSETFAEKIVKIMDMAMKTGAPIIGLNDSGGARIQEGVMSLAGYADIFYRNTRSSGVIPQISAIMGPCAGGAVYSPGITDFVFMVEKTSYMFVTGPNVVKTVTQETVTSEELGGAFTHATKSGVTHFSCKNEAECIYDIRKLLSYLPSNCEDEPPFLEYESKDDESRAHLDNILPENPNQPYDMKEVIQEIIDQDSFLEVHEQYAENIIVGFARLGGRSIGIVANQPMSLAGVLDNHASKKGARFNRFCDCFNIPLLVLVDVPGFLPGTDQEWNGIISNGSKILYAFSEATVPRISVIIRKAYGGAYDVMNSKHIGSDMNYAWPTAEIAVMGPQGAAEIIFRREIQKSKDPEKKLQEKINEYTEKFANPYIAASRGFIDEVIIPRNTRIKLLASFKMLENKVDDMPRKKHGNIPL